MAKIKIDGLGVIEIEGDNPSLEKLKLFKNYLIKKH